MPARKKTAVPTQDTVSINDACLKYMTTEQGLRLALSNIRPDDFDTVKAITEADLEAIAPYFQPQLPAHSENSKTLETSTHQGIDPTTEQPQNAPIVPQSPQQHLAAPTQYPISNPQSPTPNTGLSLVEQLAKQATEEIAAVDAIAQVRNTLILNNLAVRDAELVEGINQRWQHQKQEYLGTIRDLANLAKQPVEITPDETDFTQEIDDIINELGKKLIA